MYLIINEKWLMRHGKNEYDFDFLAYNVNTSII